ncbi:MAG: efflux RND transporter permease subunit, partial [Polyangiales bacterium]
DPVVEGDEITEAESEELRRVLSDAPLVEGRLVSQDGTVAVVALQLDVGDDRHETVTTAIESIDAHIADNEPPKGADVHIGGLPYLRSSMVQKMKTDRRVLMPLTVFVCLLILYLSYRWFAGTLLPMIAVGMTTVVVVGGMAVFGAQMNVLTNIIPPLLVIIGICESIHLVGRYREELAKGDGRIEAGERTVRTMAVACFLASLTTAIGLGSLVVSGSDMLRTFGIVAGLGVMVAYVVTVTFLPSVLTMVPKPKHIEQTERRGLERAIVLLTQGVLRAPWTIVAATAVLLGLSIWGATKLDVDHALLDQFDEDEPVYQTTRLMETKLEGIRPLELHVEAAEEGAFDDPKLLSELDRIEEWAQEQPEVISTMGPGDILHETWSMLTGDATARDEALKSESQVQALQTLLTKRDQSPLHAFVTEDGKHARIQIRLKDVGAKRTLELIEELDAKVTSTFEDHENVEISYAGDAYTGSKSLNAVVTDLLGSLLMAIAIIFVLLTVLLRSFRLGLLSIPSNVIPLIMTMAYMVVRGIPLNAATVIIFSISIGLAVDSTIHVLARYREETLAGLGSSQALLRAARGTGQAIVVSNLTLMVGFAVLTMSSFVPVRNFGELIAITVGGCLIATLVVQPALLKIAGLPRRAELEAASL